MKEDKMSKYILIYKSPAGFDMAKLPKQQIVQAMSAWGEWLGAMGPKVVDKGDMFKAMAKSVGMSDTKAAAEGTSGYSIINADCSDDALAQAANCPIINQGGRVEVYEAFGL
jgi:hypothetical protein